MTTVKIHPETRPGQVSLAVSDLDRSLKFYRDVLSFRPRQTQRNLTSLTADGSTPLLELVELVDARPKPSRTTGLYHFAILVPNRVALARSMQRLLDTRYPLQGASDHLVSEAVYLADPDGNGIEIYADRPRERWPHRGGTIVMATDPLDVDDLLGELANTRDESDEFMLHPDTRIGHIHLRVRDLAEAETFYCGLLGFEVMQRDYPGALFVSAGGYHHHIGLNTWGGVGAPPPLSNSVGLRYFTISLPNEAELRQLLKRLDGAEVRPERMDAGLFVRDPSGNGILLAVGRAAGIGETPAARHDA